MILFARSGGHYARDDDFQGLLATCRESPGDDAPRLILADWLDEWEPAYPLELTPAARHHARFLRDQLAHGYKGERAVLRGAFGRDAAHCQKMWFHDTLTPAPWLGTPKTAVINSTATGVYYHRGLPAAVKCRVEDLARYADLVRLWRVPDVYINIGSGELGVCYTRDPRTQRRKTQYVWRSAPLSVRVDRWVDGDTIPPGADQDAFVIATVLTRAFAAECPGTAFHAVHRRRWRSFHPPAKENLSEST